MCLRPGGRLVAVTNGAGHLAELRELSGERGWWTGIPFSRENGAELLGSSFSKVEARHADGWVTIHDDETIWGYLRSMSQVDPPERLVPHELPFRVRALFDGVRRHEMIRPAELIQRKRDGGELTDAELSELTLGYARGEVPDYQMAAFCMAVFFRGLSERETYALTDAMIASGETDRSERDARPEGRRQALDRRRR